MKWYEAAGIGVIMGCLYGITLWASMDTFSTASFILYGNARIIPVYTTLITISLAFLVLFSYPWWVEFVGRNLIEFVNMNICPHDNEDSDSE